MKTNFKIIQILKEQGEMSAKSLSDELSLTTMGVRQHLLSLEESGDVAFHDKKVARGRPTRNWFLTEKSNRHFSDRHEILTVQLIDSIKTVFGDSGLNKLIEDRESKTLEIYHQEISAQPTLLAKVEKLAAIRSDEGYMASVEPNNKGYLLLENHCPICVAAAKCNNFCRSELSIFQTVFQGVAQVERVEHIFEGARRCAYSIMPK